MSRPIARTGFFAIPAVVGTAVTMAPGIAFIGSKAWQAYSGYVAWRTGDYYLKMANSGFKTVLGSIGLGSTVVPILSTAATNTTVVAAALTNTTAMADFQVLSPLLSAGMMWKTWRVIADQFKSKHGKKKLAQLGATSDAKLKEALADESSASAAWKLAYFEKMGKNAPEWLQKRSPEDISIVLGFLFVLLTFFQKWGAEEMRKNTMAMDVDYNHPLESGLASESPADFLQEPRRRCYGLYLKNKYYRKDGGGALQPYFDSGTVFRTIANIIIGMLTLNPLINFKTNDPVSVFLKGAEVLGYWEVLTRLIGLYGLAPVYITTHWLLQSLTPPPKKKKGVVAQALSYIKKA